MILVEIYISHGAALEMTGLKTLHMRREQRCLQFALKCTQHDINQAMFSLKKPDDTHDTRNRENFNVKKAWTKRYKKSTIPYLQRRLNTHFEHISNLRQAKEKAAAAQRRAAQDGRQAGRTTGVGS